jgi:hypothetical protein
MIMPASDFRRHCKLSKGQQNGPRREIPVRGPTRLWRTLTWLFLAGLLPSRARLRFTKHYNYSVGAFQEIPERNQRRTPITAARLHRPFFFGRRGPRGR